MFIWIRKKMNNKSFGENVRETRIKAGFSQQQLANKLGWNQNKIWRLERGQKKAVDIGTAKKIATALGYPLSEISSEYSEDHLSENNNKIIPSRAVDILVSSLPNEIPVFLQSKFTSINDKNYWAMEYADPKGFTPGELKRRFDIFGLIMESYYDLPNFDITDIIIINSSRTPREPQATPGIFDPDYWDLYYRVFIKAHELGGFNVLPGLWIGAGKIFIKPRNLEAVILDPRDYEFLGTAISRRIFFKDSALETMLAQEGIVKNDSLRSSMPVSVEKYIKRISSLE